jgi:hypothetical protein
MAWRLTVAVFEAQPTGDSCSLQGKSRKAKCWRSRFATRRMKRSQCSQLHERWNLQVGRPAQRPTCGTRTKATNFHTILIVSRHIRSYRVVRETDTNKCIPIRLTQADQTIPTPP